ncbi:Protein of unknown function [Ferrimonas sediminum]|uniref:DUF3010 domain-containing protein n=1 Tax=Ferrimonas sediminum TaxID=718193 RepID=A0A1G8P0F0_9GAMM|nr:DUF3010 family protein [Ferrimonas sediminum]SDI85963.1 Protein of unknown function [Ferrimonas sediminum]
MKICAVELKSNEAIVCILGLDRGLFNVAECRARKLTLNDGTAVKPLKAFQAEFAKLVSDYKVDKVVIRERPMKGKFAGSAIGFKMEAAMQLAEGIDVEVVSGTAIKESLKRQPVDIGMKEVGLKQFQEHAFATGYAYLNMKR